MAWPDEPVKPRNRPSDEPKYDPYELYRKYGLPDPRDQTQTEVQALRAEVAALTEKVDGLTRKIDHIFGSYFLVEGKFVTLKQLAGRSIKK